MSRARLMFVAVAAIAAAALPAPALAADRGGVTRIAIKSVEPAFGGAKFGRVGAYQLLSGKAYGRINPKARANAGLAYLQYAPRDADGMVRYSTDFRMLRPANPKRGNGKLFYDVINRGGHPPSMWLLNEGALSDNDAGNGFLMKRGYTIVWSAWQPEADRRVVAYKPYFPIAKLPGGKPIVKRSQHQMVPDFLMSYDDKVEGHIMTSRLQYAATANPNPVLTVRQEEDDARTVLNPSSVRFVGNRQVRIDMSEAIAQGFDAGALYDLTYDAKDPYVGGLGFASVRDIVSHLRHKSRLPGRRMKATLAFGESQDGRYLKDFVWQGFNADLSGRRVFDGVMAMVSGAKKTDHNLPPETSPFPQTTRWVRQHEDRDYPGNSFPFTYRTLFDPLTGQTDGILRSCRRSGTCPKIIHLDSDGETWGGHSSLVVTDTLGRPITMPKNVRIYQITGQEHGPGYYPPEKIDGCKLLSNPVNGQPVYRALTVALDRWVTTRRRPPASRYPTLQAGTLQTIDSAAATWPGIPGVPFNRRLFVARVGDYSVVPPVFGASYPIYVPTTDRNGNPQGGVITPDLAAPLGTYTGRNFRVAGHAEDELCTSGGSIPFARTTSQKPPGDTRPSVEELYPRGARQFSALRRRAAAALVRARLLLPGEARSYANEVKLPPR